MMAATATATATKLNPADIEIDYDALKYATPPAASLHCPICKNVLLSPVETTCHHVFCQRCIARALRDKRECPADRTPLPNGVGDLTPCSRLLLHLIDELDVFCPSHGCPRRLPRGLLPYHLAGECANYGMACVDESCSRKVPRHAALQTQACRHVLEECEHCGEQVELGQRAAHLDECRELSHQCEHCEVELSADDIQEHRLTCDEALVQCRGVDVGCDWRGKRLVMESHESGCAMHKMAPYLRARQKEQGDLQLRTAALHEALYSINPFGKTAVSVAADSSTDEPVLEISTEYSRDRTYLFSMLEHHAEALDHVHQSLASLEHRLVGQAQHESARHRDEMHFVRGAIQNMRGQMHGIVQQLHHVRLGSRFPLHGHFPMPAASPPIVPSGANIPSTGNGLAGPAGEALLGTQDVHEQVRSAISSIVSSPHPRSSPSSAAGAGISSGRSVGGSAVTSANNSTPSSPRQRPVQVAGGGVRSLSDTSSRQHVKL